METCLDVQDGRFSSPLTHVWVPCMLQPPPHLCGYSVSPVVSMSLIYLCSHRLAIAGPGPTLSQACPHFPQSGRCGDRTNSAKPGDVSSDKVPATPPSQYPPHVQAPLPASTLFGTRENLGLDLSKKWRWILLEALSISRCTITTSIGCDKVKKGTEENDWHFWFWALTSPSE